MTHTLTAEQIQDNWISFKSNIEKYISSPRKEKLLELYEEIEDHIILAPAAITNDNHNCTPGGYVDHINRVLEIALELNGTWNKWGGNQDFTIEELAFTCINHDLGKLGIPGIPGCMLNDNDWEVSKRGMVYKYNTDLPFSTVPDRGIFVLQSKGIVITQNEFIAIKTHDGLYDESNKPYLVSYRVESRLRNYLPILVHQADMIASRVEWEVEWFKKLNKGTRPSTNTSTVMTMKEKPKSYKKPKLVDEALKRITTNNPAILEALKNI